MSIATFANPSNAEHVATIEAVDGTLVVSVGETIICSSDKAVRLLEQSPKGKYPPVLYFPTADTSDVLKQVSGRTSHCPLKGDASYFSIDGQEVAWIYDRPLKDAALLAEYIGFFSDKVNITKA